MWQVTTQRDRLGETERVEYERSVGAWDDYTTRIFRLELDGFLRDGEEATEYGRKWYCSLVRGTERVGVEIERTASPSWRSNRQR